MTRSSKGSAREGDIARKGQNPGTFLVGMYDGAALGEDSLTLLKKLKLPYDQQFHSQAHAQENYKHMSTQKNIIHTALFIIAKKREQFKC